jgi:hypothetical protein
MSIRLRRWRKTEPIRSQTGPHWKKKRLVSAGQGTEQNTDSAVYPTYLGTTCVWSRTPPCSKERNLSFDLYS